MSDLEKISTQELLHDYAECLEDVMLCMFAISLGAVEYEGNCIQCRLENNLAMASKIRSELMRREDPVGAALENMEPKYG